MASISSNLAPAQDTALPLPGRLVVNGGPEGEETRKRDAQLLRGDAHRVDLKPGLSMILRGRGRF